MTTNELMKHLTSEPKFYAGKMGQSTAGMIKRRWFRKEIKLSTLEWFFGKFGYRIAGITWEKIPDAEMIKKVA